MLIDEWIQAVLDLVASTPPWLRILVSMIAIALETSVLVGLIVPGDTVMLVSATGTENVLQWAALIAAGVIGALAGESLGYLIGSVFRPRILRVLIRRKPWFRRWKAIERRLLRRGGPFIFLSRFLPVAHSLVPLVVGASSFAYRRFLFWTLPACLLWATLYASAGWAAAGTFQELSRTVRGAGYFFVAIIVVFMIAMWAIKRLMSALSRD